jgi:hypothetical protein
MTKKFTITKEQQLSAWKKANRETLGKAVSAGTGTHKNSKKDKAEKVSNTVRQQEYDSN